MKTNFRDTHAIKHSITTPPTLTLSTSLTSPQNIYTPITLLVTGGTSLLYRFLLTCNGTTSLLRDYSTVGTCTWTPSVEGEYTITVQAKRVRSSSVLTQQTISYTIVTPVVETGLSLYVATDGSDDADGSIDTPFATLEGARTAIRALDSLPEDGITVYLRGGTYQRTTSFALTTDDVGTVTSPILYRNYQDEEVRLRGGQVVTGFSTVTDPLILARIPEAARPYVKVTNLADQGITDYGTYYARHWGVNGLAALEVFFNDSPMTLARYPNAGEWMEITSAPDGQSGARFGFSDAHPATWQSPDIWLHGYWTWNWADSDTKVAAIDAENSIITTEEPYGTYGYTVGGRFFAQNILEELDSPGEWYLDSVTGDLYFWPPSETGEVVVSLMEDPIITLTGSEYITIQGLTIECCRGFGVTITNGSNNAIQYCTIRNTGSYAVKVKDGASQGVAGCIISGCGDGGILLDGTNDLYATNNSIHDYSRWTRCYHPGVKIIGDGCLVAHNLIYNAPHNAIHMAGTNHIIEYNEIHSVCSETQDAGAFYTYTGDSYATVRYNYFHDLGLGYINETQYSATGAVYFDGGASYGTITGNLFVRCNVAVIYSGGGNYLEMDNNVVTDCIVYQHADNSPVGCTTTHNIFDGGQTEYWNGVTTTTMGFSNNLIGVDPLFVNPGADNYALQVSSPAYSIGFTDLPLDSIGLE